MSQNLVDLTSRAFSDSLAARTATPGGGSLAALLVADAAALLCMVARFSTGEAYAEVSRDMEARCSAGERARQRALELVDLDARSYDAVSAAFKLPKADDEQKAARTAAIQSASKGALETPLETMERACEVLECLVAAAAGSNKNLVTDLASGGLAAHAGLEAAWLNVRINAGSIKDKPWVDERLARGEALRQRARAAVESLQAHVQSALT